MHPPDPRRLQRRQSVGSLQGLAEAAEKGKALHPARLKTAPKISDKLPFEKDATLSRFYATQLMHSSGEKLPPFAIDDESVRTFRRSPAKVAFTGVLRLSNRRIYLCPLVPLKGSVEYPDKYVATSYITADVPATPIVHTDIKQRQATGTGEASHDQLAKRVGAAEDAVGFTIWKGPRGDAICVSFTSRSQNSAKFGEVATTAEIRREVEKNKEAQRKIKEDAVRYKKEMEEFEAQKDKIREINMKAAAESAKTGGPPPAPVPPPVGVRSFGFSVRAQNTATMTALDSSAKGVNPDGLVSIPYAVAILQTLHAYFPPTGRLSGAGKQGWEI